MKIYVKERSVKFNYSVSNVVEIPINPNILFNFNIILKIPAQLTRRVKKSREWDFLKSIE